MQSTECQPLCCISIIHYMYSHYAFRIRCKNTPLYPDWLAAADDFIYLPGNLRLQQNMWPVSLFCQTSHWAKVLLPAKGCNLSRTWLVRPRPITACLSGSSVWQTDSKSARAPAGALELSCTSQTALYTRYLPAGSPLCRRLACFVNTSMRMKTWVYSEKYFFFSFSTAACIKVQNVILIIYDAGADNKRTFHPEGTL